MSAQPVRIPAPPVMHASRDIESVRTPSNDERRAHWAIRYFAAGLHRAPQKPRIKVTVSPPQSRAASPDPLPADVEGTSTRLVARQRATEYAADECASARSPDYWAEAPASYESRR